MASPKAAAFGECTADSILGNRALLQRLDRDIRSGQLSHAYILDGPVGSGRHTIARHITAALACVNRPGRISPVEDSDQMGFFDALDVPVAPPPIPEDAPIPCGVCPACQKVYEGKCPDIRIIGKEGKASIGVEAVRFLKQDVLIPPNDLDTKIYVVEDAEAMTTQAQNALLLTLEEPPAYVLFLLLCNGADNLLETIRSRAPVLRTEPIPEADIRTYLKKRGCSLPEEDLEAVILRADGCIGQALTLSDSRAVKPIRKLRALCDEIMEVCAARRYDRLPAALSELGSKRESVRDALSLLTLAVRDLILLRQSEDVKLKYYTDREQADALAGRFTSRSLLALYEGIGHAADGLEANANVRLTLMGLAVEISR